jgi:hypothetical protein
LKAVALRHAFREPRFKESGVKAPLATDFGSGDFTTASHVHNSAGVQLEELRGFLHCNDNWQKRPTF